MYLNKGRPGPIPGRRGLLRGFRTRGDLSVCSIVFSFAPPVRPRVKRASPRRCFSHLPRELPGRAGRRAGFPAFSTTGLNRARPGSADFPKQRQADPGFTVEDHESPKVNCCARSSHRMWRPDRDLTPIRAGAGLQMGRQTCRRIRTRAPRAGRRCPPRRVGSPLWNPLRPAAPHGPALRRSRSSNRYAGPRACTPTRGRTLFPLFQSYLNVVTSSVGT